MIFSLPIGLKSMREKRVTNFPGCVWGRGTFIVDLFPYLPTLPPPPDFVSYKSDVVHINEGFIKFDLQLMNAGDISTCEHWSKVTFQMVKTDFTTYEH